MKRISLIAAIAKGGVIGHQGKMPWHIPGELQHFKAVTMGKPVIMGRKTYESIGKPLPGRRNIVITRQFDWYVKDCDSVNSLSAALDLVQDVAEVMVIGGAQIYAQALPLANRLYLTIIDHEYQGDAFFPQWNQEDWAETSRELQEVGALSFSYVTLDRK